jgi:beta-glucosidase
VGSAFLPAVGRRPFRDPALPWDQRVDDLLRRLTLEERIALLHRVAAWLGGATVFPQAVGLGAIWGGDLVHEVATAVSVERRAFHRHRRPTIGSGTNSLGRDRPW